MNRRLLSNARLCLPLLAVLVAAPLCAQQPEREPAPEPPLLAAAPNPVAWTVEIRYKRPVGEPPSDPRQAKAWHALRQIYPRILAERAVLKGTSWVREVFYDNKTADTFWCHGGYGIVQYKNFRKDRYHIWPLGSPQSEVKATLSPEFPELTWVSAKTFVRKESRNGLLCHLHESGELRAWIDDKTRLPVAMEDAELQRFYHFAPAPATLEPKGIFAEALQNVLDAKAADEAEARRTHSPLATP